MRSLGVAVLVTRAGVGPPRETHRSEMPERLGIKDIVENDGTISETAEQMLAIVSDTPRWPLCR